MPTRLQRLLALVLMFSVQFATLGMMPSECEVEGRALHHSAAAGERIADDMSGMGHHAALVSATKASQLPDASTRSGGTTHNCAPEQGLPESGSHPVHCELAAPCGSLVFTTAASAERMSVAAEHHSTVMSARVPASMLPAPDAPPPRA